MGVTRRAAVPQPPATVCNTNATGDKSAAGASATKGGMSQRSCLTSQLRKTKICTYHLRGTCQYGNDCAFAHSCTELQSTPDLRKTRLCEAFEAGECTNPKCSFAHGEEELRSTNLFYKKTLCMWNQKGKCRNGDQCRFAHGVSELRGSSPASETSSSKSEVAVASPTAEKSKKVSVAAPSADLDKSVTASLKFEPMKVVTSQTLVETQVATQAPPLSLWPPGLGPEMEAPVCSSGSTASGDSSCIEGHTGLICGASSGWSRETTPDLVEQHFKDEMARLFEDVSMLAEKCGQMHWQMQGAGGFSPDSAGGYSPDYLVADPQWPNMWY